MFLRIRYSVWLTLMSHIESTWQRWRRGVAVTLYKVEYNLLNKTTYMFIKTRLYLMGKRQNSILNISGMSQAHHLCVWYAILLIQKIGTEHLIHMRVQPHWLKIEIKVLMIDSTKLKCYDSGNAVRCDCKCYYIKYKFLFYLVNPLYNLLIHYTIIDRCCYK